MMTPSVASILYPTDQDRAAAVVILRAEIIALRRARASGMTSLSYEGKSANYADLASLNRRLSQAEAELLMLSGYQGRRPQAGFSVFNRGNR